MLGENRETVNLEQLFGNCACRLEIPETVRLNFDRPEVAPSGFADARRWPRYRMAAWVRLEYRKTLPGMTRNSDAHRALLISLSRGGAGFMHSEQLYPHECVELKMQRGESRLIEVVYCRRLGQDCFQVCGKFVKVSAEPMENPSLELEANRDAQHA